MGGGAGSTVIHDNDVEGLKQLLAEYPALPSWQDDDDHGGLLGFATGAYADAGDAQRGELCYGPYVGTVTKRHLEQDQTYQLGAGYQIRQAQSAIFRDLARFALQYLEVPPDAPETKRSSSLLAAALP